MFMICLWYVYDMFMICLWYVYGWLLYVTMMVFKLTCKNRPPSTELNPHGSQWQYLAAASAPKIVTDEICRNRHWSSPTGRPTGRPTISNPSRLAKAMDPGVATWQFPATNWSGSRDLWDGNPHMPGAWDSQEPIGISTKSRGSWSQHQSPICPESKRAGEQSILVMVMDSDG